MTENYDKYNPYEVRLFLEKTYIPKIENLLREKEFQKNPEDRKTEDFIKKEAENIIDSFFTLAKRTYLDYSQIFLKWYTNKSFENESLINIIYRMEYFCIYIKPFSHEDHQNYETYQDFLKTQEVKFAIDPNTNIKNFIKTTVDDKEIFNILREFFRFCQSTLIFKENEIILSFKNFDHDRTLHLFHEEIPDQYKKKLDQEIMTLKEMYFVRPQNYLERDKYSQKTTEYAQKIFDDLLLPLFEKKGLFKNFSDLNKTLQTTILEQIESYKIFRKKIKIVTDLFQVESIIVFEKKDLPTKENQENQENFTIKLKKHSTITPEDFGKIKKFLNIPKINLQKSYITPEEYIWGIKSKIPHVIHSFPDPITAHDKIRLKKLFLSL